jgi:dephospho-CoA kinase
VIAVEGAMLIEANRQSMFDQMWVVTLPKEEAFKRVKVRNPDMLDSDITNRLERQLQDSDRLKHAHFSYCSLDPYEVNKKKIDKQLDEILAKL